jgi:hypothetical protein
VPSTASPSMAAAMLEGIANGWPQGNTPTFTAEQTAALKTAARGASPELMARFTQVATRLGNPTLFTP